MNYIYKSLLTVALCLTLCLPELYCEKPGTTGLNFLKIEVGARASGTGGAYSAVADDASAVYWNPAGLAQLRYKEISVMQLSWLESVNYQFLSFVQPTISNGTLALSAYYLSVNDIPSYDSSGGNLNSSLSASDLALALSYGKKINSVDCGLSAKFIQEKLADTSAVTYAFDAGLLYRINTGALKRRLKNNIGQELRIALGVQNIGPEIKFVQEKDPLPLNYRLGLAQDFFDDNFTLSIDVNKPRDNDYYINSGIEYRITDWVSLRGGYKFMSNRPQYDVQPGFMGGLGLGNQYVRVDYAFVPYSGLGNTHRVSLNYRFGKVYNENLIEDRIQKLLKKAQKYYQKKDLVNAYYCYNNVLLIDPINAQAKEYSDKIGSKINEIKIEKYLKLVKKYIEQDKLIEAKELIDKVLLLFPENAEAKDFHARVQLVFQQQKAMRVESMFKQAQEFFENKRYEAAISLLENVLAVNPGHGQAKEYIVMAKMELAKIAEAKKKEMEKLLSEKSDLLFKEASKLYRSRNWEKAKEAFAQLKVLNPAYPELDKYLALIDKQMAERYYNNGLKLYKEKNLKDAIASWQEALGLDPQNNKINELLAKVTDELKEINKAQAEEYSAKGLKEYGLGNLKTAVELWEKALELDPENVKTKNNLARAKEELEKKK